MENSKKILIVEDDENFISILQKVLISAGFTVITSPDGENGVSRAIREAPDLIISDMLLPKLDGHEMVKKISEAKLSIPVIFLTNIKNGEKDKNFEYLIKSEMHLEDVVAKVKKKLGVK